MPIEFSTPRAQMLAVGGDAVDAFCGQRQAAGAQMIDALEQAVRDDRLERVELQLAGLGGKAHGDVVADHLEGDLVDDLGNHRIDLARHDAGARLHRRQIDLVRARRAGPTTAAADRCRSSTVLTATRLSTPESCTNAPQSCVASTRLVAVTTGMPVIGSQMPAHQTRHSPDAN